jgi:DNA repair exonuclease SbcCD ATPase subunit
MDTAEISAALGRIATTLSNTESVVNKLARDSEELETRIVRIEQQIEVNAHSMKGFWERDWNNMLTEIKSVNEKLQQQLNAQAQNRSEVELMKQRMDFVTKVYDEKISKLEKCVESGQIALWKLIGAGAGSGAVITGLIEIISSLMK